MKPRIVDYKIVEGYRDDVEEEAEELMALGFQPAGRLVYAGRDPDGDARYAQTFVRYEPPLIP